MSSLELATMTTETWRSLRQARLHLVCRTHAPEREELYVCVGVCLLFSFVFPFSFWALQVLYVLCMYAQVRRYR